MPVGNRIFLQRILPSEKLLSAYRELEASAVADAMQRLCAMHPRIHLISSPRQPTMCGTAITVKSSAGDNLMLHEALNMAGANDVIVVSNEGGSHRALMGEIMSQFAFSHKHIAGVVLDGPIRDIAALRKMDAFLFATGATPGGPYKNGPGEINVPISCGNISVNPGDIIIGDADGVVVVPKREAETILKQAQRILSTDREKTLKSALGQVDRSWVSNALQAVKCEYLECSYED